MSHSRLVALGVLFLVVACSTADEPSTSRSSASIDTGDVTPIDASGPTSSEATAASDPPGTEPQSTPAPTTTTTLPAPPPEPIVEQVLVRAGPEEVVYDWSEDRCDDLTLPDIATRVVRRPDGMLQLYIGNIETYAMIGPDFDSLEIDCANPIMTSGFDPDPSRFDDHEWIGATYTEDGRTVYAIVHNEYLGKGHPDERPGQCPTATSFDCIDASLTLGVSTDGGATFRDALEPPAHLIASMPYRFDDDGRATGIWQPSNLVDRGDGFLYMLANVSGYPTEPGDTLLNWVCAMRTDDIADPTAWRYWDGAGFDGVFTNPYVVDPGPVETAETCARVDFPALSGEMSESIVWSDVLQAYVIVGGTHEPGRPDDRGIYYSTSTDLIEWSPRRRLMDAPVPGDITLADTMPFSAYPTLVDHDSPSLNYDTIDDEFFLYTTRFNAGTSSLDRDLLRIPVEIVARTIEPSVWAFDDDSGGWSPDVDISEFGVDDGVLRIVSTGDDPYFSATGLNIPADYDTVSVTMAVEGPDNFAQLFFQTDEHVEFGDSTVIGFEVDGGGESRTYELDMSTIPAWNGRISALRFDPVTTGTTTIEIDEITVGP